MRKIVIVGIAALMSTACTTTQQNVAAGAGVGAATGAVVGAAATGDAEGALVGAAVGAGTGAVVGAAVSDQPGYCYARDRFGRQIIVEC